jgi:hypothetical protein
VRRLEADYVAGTIAFMMGQEPKTEQQPRYFGYWDGRSRPAEESAQDKFRVDADVAGNRLLVWANDVEMEEVRKLLVKLGEIPAEGGIWNGSACSMSTPAKTTGQLLEQIRRAWPALAPNPIVLPSGTIAAETAASPGTEPRSQPPRALQAPGARPGQPRQPPDTGDRRARNRPRCVGRRT